MHFSLKVSIVWEVAPAVRRVPGRVWTVEGCGCGLWFLQGYQEASKGVWEGQLLPSRALLAGWLALANQEGT